MHRATFQKLHDAPKLPEFQTLNAKRHLPANLDGMHEAIESAARPGGTEQIVLDRKQNLYIVELSNMSWTPANLIKQVFRPPYNLISERTESAALSLCPSALSSLLLLCFLFCSLV